MTTGEKIAALRKKNGITQEQIAEILKVSRQSVSRWEMDIAFPETEKLIKLSRLLGCSIDFLFKNEQMPQNVDSALSVSECFGFIRKCSYFFLSTSTDNTPHLRPMGFIYSDGNFLYISTDKCKQVYDELMCNPNVEIASYNLSTGRWIRVKGMAEIESSGAVREEMITLYPLMRQEFTNGDEIHSVIFRVTVSDISRH